MFRSLDMHTDARTLDNRSTIEGDICIVGTGAAGMSIALEWMRTPYKVILLEGGGFRYEDPMQDLFAGKITGQKYYPLRSTRLHYFGGTTGHWGGMCSLFDPIVFAKRDWVPNSGWPFGQEEMIPYYKRAHPVLDLGEFSYDVAHFQKLDPELLQLPLDSKVYWNKIWHYSPPTRLGSKYKDTILGSGNTHLYTYAHVVGINTIDNVSRVKELTVTNLSGKVITVKARFFVLATGAIQGARLLLASNGQAPQGLGNDHDNVGRYFMEHPEIKSAELWLRKRYPINLYLRNKMNIRAELAIMPKVQEELGVLNGIVSLLPLAEVKEIPPFIKVWTDDDPRENEKRMANLYNKNKVSRLARLFNPARYTSYQLTMRLEQSPNPDSRVTLDTEKDAFGIPLVKLNWVFTPLEKYSVRKIYQLLGKQVGAAGIGRVRLLEGLQDENDVHMPETTSAGWHHMGTMRMHEDPKRGVVNADCRVHGIENLYIASSACFPTSGGVNPTLTIVALAIRLSDHLKSKIRSQPR
ncbi:MAG: GMC oxidoreductase [Gammaproteobacteria bacterium]